MAQRPKEAQATPLLPAPSQFALSALVRILNQKIGDQLKEPQFHALHLHLGPHVAVFATVWAPAPVQLANTTE